MIININSHSCEDKTTLPSNCTIIAKTVCDPLCLQVYEQHWQWCLTEKWEI